jgi:hypothetical protein
MKKHSRLTALLLALFMLLGSAACSGGQTEETTEAETASTTAPETTEANTLETTEESITVVAPPETTSAPETEPPKPEEIIHIIMQDGKGEAILSALAEDKYKPLLDAREKALLYDHSAQIELSKAENLENTVKNHALAGDSRYDLVLIDPMTGIELLSEGALENLASAGISITPDSIGVGKSITESLSVGKGIYLFASDALVSDITSTYAIRYNGAKLSSDPIEKVIAGGFTTEAMLTYIAESENIFSVGSASPQTLFRGVGGTIFAQNEKGIPSSAVNADTEFSAAYDSALGLYSKSTDQSAVFTLEKLSPLSEGEIYLPIPKANADKNYSAPIDHNTVYLFAAPAGVISGTRLNALATALASCSNDYREAVRGEIIGKGSEKSAEILDIIENGGRLDLGILFGWGDLCEHVENGLKKNRSGADILADRMTEMRNKAAETAASILADKLGIK